jgi:multicomponent Na+:H+ antiporter subunit G
MNVVALGGAVVAVAGITLLVVAALGLFRLPDALARQHAATKSVTLALGLVLIGLALHQQGLDPSLASAWWSKVGVMLVLLLLTLPVASHMLARAATRETFSPDELRVSPKVDPTPKR